MNTAALVAAVFTGITGLIAGMAGLLRSRSDAATAVAKAAVELLDPAREQVRYLTAELDKALAKLAAFQRRVDELEAQLRMARGQTQ